MNGREPSPYEQEMEAAYRALRFSQASEQEIMEALRALAKAAHNNAIEGAQAMLRRDAIMQARNGRPRAFSVLEEEAMAIGVLTI